MLAMVTNADDTLSKHLNTTDYSKDDVMAIVTEDDALKGGVEVAKQMYGFGLSSLKQAKQELSKLVENASTMLSGEDLKKEYRSILGDDPNTMDKKFFQCTQDKMRIMLYP